MANTYTQIYIHIVFAVQGRQNLIRREHNDELQKYMTGIISGQGQKLIALRTLQFVRKHTQTIQSCGFSTQHDRAETYRDAPRATRR